MIAVLLLGTNLGDCLANLKNAISLIRKQSEKISAISSVYKTEPWGFESEHWFYNMVVVIETKSDVFTLFNKINLIEKEMGRNEKTIQGYSDRLIDIDILFFEDIIINNSDLIIPHPKLHFRKFALAPLVEIMPDYVHPLLNKTIQKLHDECEDKAQCINTGEL